LGEQLTAQSGPQMKPGDLNPWTVQVGV
jgi:hypothetical protein